MWAWLIKQAENTTGSNEFSYYCSIQGALSLWNPHPLVRQKRFCLPICRYKRLRFPKVKFWSLCTHQAALRYSYSCSLLRHADKWIIIKKKNPKAWLQPSEVCETQRTLWNLKLSKSEFQSSFYPRMWNTLSLIPGFISGTLFTLKHLLVYGWDTRRNHQVPLILKKKNKLEENLLASSCVPFLTRNKTFEHKLSIASAILTLQLSKLLQY